MPPGLPTQEQPPRALLGTGAAEGTLFSFFPCRAPGISGESCGASCVSHGKRCSEVNALRFPSSCGWGFSSFPNVFWALHPGVPAFTGYHMLDVARLGAPRHWPSSPLHHTHPTAVLSAPRTAHMKNKIPIYQPRCCNGMGFPIASPSNFWSTFTRGWLWGPPFWAPITAHITPHGTHCGQFHIFV